MSGYPVFIGIGSNIGDAADNCIKAIKEIGLIKGNRIIAVSSLYRTEPISHIEQDWFINCVIKIETDLTPYSLLSDLQDVEKRLGRKRDMRHGPRTIDLDILLYDNLIVDEERLRIPHPEMHKRRFVLEPLAEIDENLIHPVIKKSIRLLLSEIGTVQRVELLRPYKL
jgi:2-amino-4-hydroxy-6-hydroxymethyldihydropteridine diphosphokinase